MSNNLRTADQLNRAALTSSIRNEAKELLALDDDIQRHKGLMKNPSTRKDGVEELYGCKIDKLIGEDRERAEKVAYLHDPFEVWRFSEFIDARRTKPCGEVQRKFHRNLVKELETEIEKLEAYLSKIPIPLDMLYRRLHNAKEAANDNGDMHGLRCTFNGILD